MVELPAGELALANGEPVRVERFCLDLSEVTVGRFAGCVAASRCSTPRGKSAGNTRGTCNWQRADHEAHPMNCVDSFEAEAFCKAEGKRLPDDVEWEWAARAGAEARRYPWGADPPATRTCTSHPATRTDTCPVGSFPAGNGFGGLQDLAGNVWEWTVREPRIDGARGHRGGGFETTNANALEVTLRVSADPRDRSAVAGFRCAR